MGTSREEIKGWLDEAKKNGSTHLIVAVDHFDHEDYPVFVKKTDKVRDVANRLLQQQMTGIMEVYAMHLPLDKQLSEHRAVHYEDPPADMVTEKPKAPVKKKKVPTKQPKKEVAAPPVNKHPVVCQEWYIAMPGSDSDGVTYHLSFADRDKYVRTLGESGINRTLGEPFIVYVTKDVYEKLKKLRIVRLFDYEYVRARYPHRNGIQASPEWENHLHPVTGPRSQLEKLLKPSAPKAQEVVQDATSLYMVEHGEERAWVVLATSPKDAVDRLCKKLRTKLNSSAFSAKKSKDIIVQVKSA